MNSKFILASNSPRRRELLQNIGYKFCVEQSHFDETNVSSELPVNMYVQQLAMYKACSVAKSAKYSNKNYIVIGADTVVYNNSKILGKPKNRDEAYNMLKLLSNTSHEVYTGIALVHSYDFKIVTDCEKTTVYFKELTDEEIYYYIDKFKPFDKAGAYGIQEYAATFVKKIDGDYFNVVGLPLCKLNSMIQNEFKEE